MKAYIHKDNLGIENIHFADMKEPEPQAGEVKIRLKVAGLNHHDIWSLERRDLRNGPIIMGADGAGVIEDTGSDVGPFKIGDEVIIHPGLNWKSKKTAPPKKFDILGDSKHGTFAEYIVIDYENITYKPTYLTWEEAGVYSLAALTAYRALFTKGNLQSGQTVLIPGIGGGVATFALLMAKAIDANVVVTSRHSEKINKAIELGANEGVLTESNWSDELADPIDLVIESVGAATWEKSIDSCRNDGTIVCFGATSGKDVSINLRDLYFSQKNILGTTLGSTEEFKEMIEFVTKYQVRPVIDQVVPLQDTHEAFEMMKKGNQFGKIAIKIR